MPVEIGSEQTLARAVLPDRRPALPGAPTTPRADDEDPKRGVGHVPSDIRTLRSQPPQPAEGAPAGRYHPRQNRSNVTGLLVVTLPAASIAFRTNVLGPVVLPYATVLVIPMTTSVGFGSSLTKSR
jgi:hypothetical protein